MSTATRIPTRLEEITASWLAEVFECPPHQIRQLSVRLPEQQVGLYAQMYFLDVVADPQSGIPDRLVAKAMSLFDATAAGMREFAVFAREATFYAEIAPRLPIRTPRAYFAAHDPSSGDGILLMEDCSRMSARDHVLPNPTSEAELLQAVDTSARVCAASWNAEWLELPELFNLGTEVWGAYMAAMQRAWGELHSHPLMRFAVPGYADLARRLGESFHDLLKEAWPRENRSLVHCDYHCGNWFYDAGRSDDPIVVFDWQAAGAGRSIFDVAYLLGGMYPPQFRRAVERRAVDRFVQRVHEGGIADYSGEQAWMDYALGMLLAHRLPPMYVADLDTSSGVGAALAEKTIGNFSAAAMDLGGHAWLDRLEERARSQSAQSMR